MRRHRLKDRKPMHGHRLQRYNFYKQRFNGMPSTRVRNISWGGLRDHDPDQCQEQPGRADQVKDGLHQIRQRKGADLTNKVQGVD